MIKSLKNILFILAIIAVSISINKSEGIAEDKVEKGEIQWY